MSWESHATRRTTQTFALFERCTSQRHPHTVWKLSMSCVQRQAAGRMRASVLVVLRARSVWTRNSSVAFTDVRTPPAGVGMARSFTKSEYTQPLVDPKQTLFDTNIELRPQSGPQPGGAVTSLPAALVLELGLELCAARCHEHGA